MKFLILVFFGFCFFVSCSSVSSVPDFSAQHNPFSKEWNSSEFYSWRSNDFVKFYESFYSNKALQECFQNAPEGFLQKGKRVEIIRAENIEQGLKKLSNIDEYHLVIGSSGFSALYRPGADEGIILAEALKAKYAILIQEDLGYEQRADGSKAVRVSNSLVLLMRFNENIAKKCPALLKEVTERYKQ